MTHARPETPAEPEAAAPKSALDWVLEETQVAAGAHPVASEFGRIERVEADALVVSLAGRPPMRAARAASCLLEPGAGDRVLVAHDGREAFVMAVLTRAAPEAATLSVDGDLTLRAKGGAVHVVADEEVTVTSAKEVSVTAPAASVRTLAGTIFSESMRYIGRTFEGEIDRVRVAAQVVDTTMERLSQKVKRAFRTVEEVDHLKAGQIDYVVDGNASIQADNTLVTAEKLVKLNGSQVHIG